ncbi:hypothetical protein [Alteromonas sp. a30]|uniref:hypothetical protein n=1 Tax=Alteromonas sp. a30 TaxID=2730917 RepID=UPI002281AC00|nr:hypothetical protein [Alteromonas sp. a30]MCY7296768.1 hypothetical protein [Alteromonas sp. a30]
MNWPVFDFISGCVVMGIGIGTDVAIATLLRANQLNTTRTILYWVIGVSLTHTLFPMIGYLLTYFSIQVLPILTPVVGVIASAFITHFLWQELRELSAKNAHPVNCEEKEDRQFLVSFGLILAVSWDALWSGPAKSAQVIGWPELLVWVSFIVVGIMVALFAIGSLYLSKQTRLTLTNTASKWHQVGLWMQYSIFAYFGLLALLRYTLNVNIVWWQLLMIAAGIMFIGIEVAKHIGHWRQASSKA